MYDTLSQRVRQTLSLCLVTVLAILALSASPVSAADPLATLTIDATPTSIEAGGVTTFKVVLTNTSGSPMVDTVLTLALVGGKDKVEAKVIQDQTTDTRTDTTRINWETFQWKGDLKKDGVLTVDVRVKSSLINESGQPATLVLTGEVGPKGESPVVKAEETVVVTFPSPVDPSKIDFTQVIEYQDGNDLVKTPEAEVPTRQRVDLTLHLLNNSDKPIYSLLIDRLQIENASAASLESGEPTCEFEVIRAGVTQGRGSVVPLRALGDEKGQNAIAAFLVKTEPGETSQARIRGTVIGTPECVLAGEASAFMTAVSPGAVEATSVDEADEAAMQAIAVPKLAFIQGLLELNPKLAPAIKFLILLSDFGDAPDSTNHFVGASMEAYPGINADFPTVFDASTGTPPGPKHRNGRPLHLGSMISAELAVDAGARKNIDPPNDNADLDVRDDGIDPLSLLFQHCIATSIEVEVTISQIAIDHFAKTDSSAFLNIWLDGNHDGDWKDELLCDGLTAREHIVIDQIINPSTAGTIKLAIPTGLIPVPQGGENETMWLRATLSDEKSVKLAGETYGDGQGPATGLRWGETEDYLYVPTAVAAAPGGFGADLSVVTEASFQTDVQADGLAAAGANKIDGKNFLKIQLRNRGDRLAPGSELVIEMDPYLGKPPTLEIDASWCLTCIVASSVAPLPNLTDVRAAGTVPIREVCEPAGDCHLEIALGDVPAGKRGTFLLGWTNADPQFSDIKFTTSVINPSDGNNDNNQASSTAIRLRREPIITSPPPGILGWTGCLTCTYAFKGFGEPNSTMTLFSDGFESGDVTVKTDEDGFWEEEIRLVDGVHEVGIMFETVGAADASVDNFNIGMPPLILSVDSSLNWDPTSFGMRKFGSAALQAAAIAEGDDSCGPWRFLDDAGRADLNGWKIPIRPNGEHELGVNLLCNNEASASLGWDDQSIVFKDDDGDGRHTASLTGQDVFITTPEIGDEVVATLQVTCGENEATYSGFLLPIDPAKVVNAETGNPLENVAVTLWQRSHDATAFRTLAPWEAQAFGQVNPQQTDSQGQFSFITPPGTYGLTTQIDGFQPFRAGPLRLQGIFPSRNIMLTPIQSDGKVAEVRITEDGFDPPYLEIEPETRIEWLNTGLGVAQVETAIPAVVSSASTATWDSGLLATSERYQQTFDQEGSYSYVNGQDPSSAATIVVKASEPVANGVRVYLPTITR